MRTATTMNKLIATSTLISGLTVAAPASAIVYNFNSGQLVSRFTLTLNAPVTTNTIFQRSQLDSATGTFYQVEFCLSGTRCNLGYTNNGFDEITVYEPNMGGFTIDPITGQQVPVTAVSVSYDFISGAFANNGTYLSPSVNGGRPSGGAIGSLQVSSGAVPEPATWGMMMLGFGGMGYVMRRKNKVAARIRFG